VSPFVAIVKAGNVAAAGPVGKKPGKMYPAVGERGFPNLRQPHPENEHAGPDTAH
jgi:hypothetical protein